MDPRCPASSDKPVLGLPIYRKKVQFQCLHNSAEIDKIEVAGGIIFCTRPFPGKGIEKDIRIQKAFARAATVEA
jgi:hypothetical protein